MMNRFFALGGLLFFIVAPLWYGWWIYHDLTHPELWDGGFYHDPRVYLPFTVLATVIVVLSLRWCYRTNCETAQRMAELKLIEAMRLMGRTDESSRLMYEYIVKWNLTGEKKRKR